MAKKIKIIRLRNAAGQFSKPQAHVRVWINGTQLRGAARTAVLKARKRKRRVTPRAPVVKPVPGDDRSPQEILEDSWRVLLPSQIHSSIRSSFRNFIMPVSRLRARISRQTFVMVKLNEPTYNPGEEEDDIIIPIRIGNFTRKQLQKMDRKDFEREISFHEKANKITEFLGVYVEKKPKGR